MPISIPFLKGKELLGIDLGTQSVKVVQLAFEKGLYVLKNAGKALMQSENLAEISQEERNNLQAQALSEVLSRLKIKESKCAASVSGSSVIVRFIKPQKMSASDLEKTIQFEAEPNIPFNIAEVSLSFQIMHDVQEEGQKKMETLLVAAKNELIQSRVEVLGRAGIKPLIIDVDAFCISNIYENSVYAEGESILCVNIGAQSTNLIIIENGVIKMVRDVFISGINFTKAIQKNLQISYAEAEALKIKHGLKYLSEEEMQSISEINEEEYQTVAILLPAVRELLTEVQRSMNYYQAQAGDKVINRILLSGGSAHLINIEKFFSNELKVPVEHFNPFFRMKLSDETFSQNEFLPEYCVACGLAIRKEE